MQSCKVAEWQVAECKSGCLGFTLQLCNSATFQLLCYDHSMLRPSIYPNLIGQAAMLEDRAFITMKHDDNPWAEGLIFTVLIGIAVAIAGFIGGLLMSASLPPANAVLDLFLSALRQQSQEVANLSVLEAMLRQFWEGYKLISGYDSGWQRLLLLVWTPLGLVMQWLFSGFLVHVVAKAVGGKGSFNQTLGATALMAAPALLRVLSVIPFVQVSALLLAVWSTLILFRAVEVVHELPWRKAAITSTVPLIVVLLLLGVIETVAIALISGGGV